MRSGTGESRNTEKNNRVGVISLGCSKNLVDTEIMLGLLTDAGFVISPSAEGADIIIINTCGFITPAKEEAIGAIMDAVRLKEEGRLKIIMVTGCLAKRYGEELMEGIPEIDCLIGPGELGKVVPLLESALAGDRPIVVGPPEFDYGKHIPRVLTTPGHWAYLKIAEGCNNRCTYCAIPGIRGGYRSRPMEVLEEEAGFLVRGGVRELILVAQDTTAYGTDIYGRPSLADLIGRIASTGAPWVRVMYCYPTGITPELIEVFRREENICRYVDLPLQHINDNILKRMNRRGSSQEIRSIIGTLRDRVPGLTLRTTLMVGFPGEGEREFEDLYSFVEETRFDRLGVFKFSPEEGTPASHMDDDVPEGVKEYRHDSLMKLQRDISLSINREKVGARVKVLVDGAKTGRSNICRGRTGGDAPEIDGTVIFSSGLENVSPGDFVPVKITGAFSYGLRGVMAR